MRHGVPRIDERHGDVLSCADRADAALAVEAEVREAEDAQRHEPGALAPPEREPGRDADGRGQQRDVGDLPGHGARHAGAAPAGSRIRRRSSSRWGAVSTGRSYWMLLRERRWRTERQQQEQHPAEAGKAAASGRR